MILKYQGNRDKDKILSVKEYLEMIKPYLSNMIIVKLKMSGKLNYR